MASPAPDRTTRASWDAVADACARLVPDLSTEAPLYRAVLAAFVELLDPDGGLVADVGCGTGRVAGALADAGPPVLGVDLSEGMLREARSARPDLPLVLAHAGALPLAPHRLAGLVAWYSLLHLPTPDLAPVLRGFARALRPGAPVLLAFQAGDGEVVERETSYGRPVRLTYHRHRQDDVARLLPDAGLTPWATVRREAALAHETTAQAFLLARA